MRARRTSRPPRRKAGGAEAIAVEAGDADVLLSPLGRAQAATLAKAVRDHDASEADWFSSPTVAPGRQLRRPASAGPPSGKVPTANGQKPL